MKKNKIPAALLAATLALGAVAPASAQFGGLGALTGGSKAAPGGSGNVEGDVTGFIEKSAAVNKLAAQSLLAISAAYATDEERANAQAQLDKLNAITDAKEREAYTAEVFKTGLASTTQITDAKDLAEKTKKLDKERQKSVAAAVTNYLIAGLRATELTKSGQGMLQSAASNPMAISKLAPVKNALPLLADAATSAGKVMPKFIDVLRGAKIEVPKVTADSKTVEISNI